MIKLGFTALMIVLQSFSSLANSSEEKPEWFTCQADSDCVDINYTCAGAVVNKKFLEDATKYYQHKNAITNCETSSSGNKSKPVPFKVFCEKATCKKQGKNPKLGFS